jgi:molybdopterin guanine dinucleotide-containing S/N-oxide reductase-like protein
MKKMSEKKNESVINKKISRRSVLKWTAGLAAAGAVGVGIGFSASELLRPTTTPAAPPSGVTTSTTAIPEEPEQIFATASNGGGHLTYVRGGRVIRSTPFPVSPDADYGRFVKDGKYFRPPMKGINSALAIGYRKYTYAADRVLYPMKRADFTPGGGGSIEGRGKGEWVRITWDEALDTIASEMKRIKEKYGNSAIAYHSASNSEQANIDGKGNTDRLLGILGGWTAIDDITYSSAGWAYGGTFSQGFYWNKGNQDTTDETWEAINNAEMLVHMGTNTLVTGASSSGPDNASMYFYLKELGKKIVVIGPRFNNTAARLADTFIPIVPGTDAALMAAIAYVWITNGTYDKEFVATHTFGFDEQNMPKDAPPNSSFKAYITGAMDGVPKTPEWAEKITGAKARVIRSLAKEWASKRTMLQDDGGHRSWKGHEIARYCVALISMQGYGKPGVNLGFSGWPGRTLKTLSNARGPDKYLKKTYDNPIEQFIMQQIFLESMTQPSVSWVGFDLAADPEIAFQTFTYPMPGYSRVRMLFQNSHSLIHARVDSNKNAKALLLPDWEFIVTTTPWWGGCDLYSDIVLPTTTLLEQSDLVGARSSIHQFIVYHPKMIEPLGEAKCDWDLHVELAKRLGIEAEFTEGKTKEDLLKVCYDKTDVKLIMSYEEFQKVGYVYNPSVYGPKYKPQVAQRWFYEMKGEDINADTGFKTPSGKPEFFSQLIWKYKKLGNPAATDPTIDPVPKYYPRKEGRYSELAQKYPLELMSPHHVHRFHGQNDNVTFLRETYKVQDSTGYEHEPVYMNPEDAEARGIKDGDIVRVFNDRGAVLAGARLTHTMVPGAVQVYQAAWYTPDNPRDPYLEKNGSVNTLMNGDGQGPVFSRAAPNVTCLVQIEKWKG